MDKFFSPASGICSFGLCPIETDLDKLDADVAVLGVPYDMGCALLTGTKMGPRRIRETSVSLMPMIDGCYDPDHDEVFLDPKKWKLVDCGDVQMITADLEGCFKNIEEAVRKIVSKGAIPAVMGGDHSITIPVARGLDAYDDLTVVQFDAHLDWSDAPGGQKFSHGSPMRRMSEMPHIKQMAQIGIRGLGSSRKSDFDAARAFGSVIITARDTRHMTIQEVLDKIPRSKHYFITIDIDGFDSGICPGSGSPAPGGLSYEFVDEVLEGITKMGEVVAFDMVEVAPVYDPSDSTTRVAAFTMANLMGYILKRREEINSK